MHRFINSLARTEFKKDVTAVEVDFQGFGSMQVYYNTMEIAASLIMLSKKNCWLLVKKDFEDMNAYQFLTFLKNWFKHPSYKRCAQVCNEEGRVAILTQGDNLNVLRHTFRNFEFNTMIPWYITLGFFADKKAANAFLKQAFVELQAYEHGEAFNYLRY